MPLFWEQHKLEILYFCWLHHSHKDLENKWDEDFSYFTYEIHLRAASQQWLLSGPAVLRGAYGDMLADDCQGRDGKESSGDCGEIPIKTIQDTTLARNPFLLGNTAYHKMSQIQKSHMLVYKYCRLMDKPMRLFWHWTVVDRQTFGANHHLKEPCRDISTWCPAQRQPCLFFRWGYLVWLFWYTHPNATISFSLAL